MGPQDTESHRAGTHSEGFSKPCSWLQASPVAASRQLSACFFLISYGLLLVELPGPGLTDRVLHLSVSSFSVYSQGFHRKWPLLSATVCHGELQPSRALGLVSRSIGRGQDTLFFSVVLVTHRSMFRAQGSEPVSYQLRPGLFLDVV